MTVDNVKEEVAALYGMPVSRLMTHTSSPYVSPYRWTLFWRLRTLLAMSLPKIGRECGGMHHTTVLHGIRRFELLHGLRLFDKRIDRGEDIPEVVGHREGTA